MKCHPLLNPKQKKHGGGGGGREEKGGGNKKGAPALAPPPQNNCNALRARSDRVHEARGRPRRAGRLGRFNPGHIPRLGGSSASRATRVEAPVGGDPVESGAERGASLEPSEAVPGGQHCVLQG